MALPEDKELIRLAQKDPLVFGRLYDQYYPKIFGYVLKRTGDLIVTQDITAETFFKALKKLWQFRWRNIPLSAWLYKIATHEITQYFRKGTYKSASLEELAELGCEPVALHNPETEAMEAQEALQARKDFLTARSTSAH